jgi:hypothetical protein
MTMPLIYAIGAVVALGLVIVDGRTFATVFPIVVTAASIATAGVIVLLWRRGTLERAVAQVRRAESVLIDRPEPPPNDVAAMLGDLRRLGFELIAATDTVVGRRSPIRVWILTQTGEPATAWVEVTRGRAPIAVFLSRAGDGRFLETSYPSGATIDDPALFARPVATGLDDALRAHQATQDEWTSPAASPLGVKTVDDYRRVEAEMRERTGGMRITAYIGHVVTPAIRRWAVCAVIGVATLLTLVLLPGP